MYNSTVLKEFLDRKEIRSIDNSENLAKVTSLCSDTSRGLWQLWHPRLSKSQDCLAVLITLCLLPNMSRNEFAKLKIREHIAQQCYRNNYSGDWRLVQELLEQRRQDLNSMLMTLMRYKDTFYLFGNLVPLIGEIQNQFRNKLGYLSVEEDRTPVVKAQRKRGYNDKGTLPDSQKLSIEYYFRVNQEEREDRRLKIKYPRSHEWLYSKRQ